MSTETILNAPELIVRKNIVISSAGRPRILSIRGPAQRMVAAKPPHRKI
jgi:hypothetical protein